MKIPELNIEVEDVGDFNDEAEQELTSFCEGLEEKGMTQPLPDNSWIWEEEGISFLWNSEAAILIRKKIDELYAIGTKYFPEEELKYLDIKSHMFVER